MKIFLAIALFFLGLQVSFAPVTSAYVTITWKNQSQGTTGGSAFQVFADPSFGPGVALSAPTLLHGAIHEQSIFLGFYNNDAGPFGVTVVAYGANASRIYVELDTSAGPYRYIATLYPPGNYFELDAKIVNASNTQNKYSVQFGGQILPTTGWIAPGGSHVVEFTSDVGPVAAAVYRSNDDSLPVQIASITPNDPHWRKPWFPDSMLIIVDNGMYIPPVDDYSIPPGTNGAGPHESIVFSNTNLAGTASEVTMQQGFNSMKTATEQGLQEVGTKISLLGPKLDGMGVSLSNINSTLDKMNARTNAPPQPNVNDQGAAGTAAAAAVKSQMQTFGTFSPGAGHGATLGDWEIDLTYGGSSHTVDLNPLSDARIASLAAACRNLATWFLRFGYVMALIVIANGHLRGASAAPQGRAAGTSIAGTNANTPIALACAAAIIVLIGAIPVFLINYLGANYVSNLMIVNPFNAMAQGGGFLSMGVALADAFFPLDLLYQQLCGLVVFKITSGAAFFGITSAIRFITG